MKFTVSSGDLLKALSIVNGVVPSKSTQPIRECILFERDGEVLRLSAKDEELSISQDVRVRFDDDEDGLARIAVPAKRIIETVRALPELSVQFSAKADQQILMTTDQGRYEMAGLDGADYPLIEPISEGLLLETNGALLRRAYQKAGFAVSSDALRMAMMGVYFSIADSGTTVVATDGHCLVKLDLSGLSSTEPFSFIIPEKALSMVNKVADDTACEMSVGSGQVSFNFGYCRVIARIIDEKYPNYEAVIPRENNFKLTVHRDSLLAAVRRVSLYSSSMTHQIRFKIEEGSIEISAEDVERASQAREHVICDFDGEPMEIGFNSSYLIDVLNNVDGDEVVFHLSNPNRAGIVTPVNQAEGEDIIMLIMPVILNNYQ